jgi:hypothetical protein
MRASRGTGGPAQAPREDSADLLMRAAAQAAPPFLRGIRPWCLRAGADAGVAELWASPGRDFQVLDPTGRVVHIACGAALLRLRLAAAVAGREPVDRLLPRPGEPLLLATIRLAGPRRPEDAERALYAAIGQEVDREPRSAAPVPASALGELAQAAVIEGAILDVLDSATAARVVALAVAAVPPHGAAPVRRPRAGSGRARHATESGPAARLAVISARPGSRAGWLRTGQALQRVLLLASTLGIATTPFLPVLEVPGPWLGSALRGLGIERPQMVLQLSPGGAGGRAGLRRRVIRGR